MQLSTRSLISLCALAALPALAAGQGRGSEEAIPAKYQPPAGMCRIWVNGVPPEQQPAPTDCATALKNNPANGRVIFGPSKDSTRAGGVSELLRSRGTGRLPVPLPGLRAPLTPPRAPAKAPATKATTPKDSSSAKRDSTAKRDTIIKRDSIPPAAR